jgi:propanol-preferring alcohol dehydrogenase
MKALLLNRISDLKEKDSPLDLADIPEPVPAENELLVKVLACGVCHTEIDEIEGRTPPPVFPIVPGHQVVGKIIGKGYK